MVSIVVPIFNAEIFLEDCIKSLISQTYKDIEIILVDDGSKDKSGAICDYYAKLDERVKVIHKENGGVSKARNIGISVAQGDYLMFCDADDMVAVNWCEYMLHFISLYPNKLIVSDLKRIISSDDILPPIDSSLEIEEKTYYDVFKSNISGSVWNKIFRADIINENHIAFREDIPLAEDVIFVSEYYSFLSEDCIHVKHPLYFYRYNNSSALHTYNPFALLYHTKAYYVRALAIEPAHLEAYCNEWLNGFVVLLNNVFDNRNKSMNLLNKIEFNQGVLCMPEFFYCMSHCSKTAEIPIIMFCLNHKNYYILYIIQRLYLIKKSILHLLKCITSAKR